MLQKQPHFTAGHTQVIEHCTTRS